MLESSATGINEYLVNAAGFSPLLAQLLYNVVYPSVRVRALS
jgi:hypothetical protein